MKKHSLPQIAYTNSVCEDLWFPFQNQLFLYSKGDISLNLITDKKPNDQTSLYNEIFIYDNAESYYKVWCDALRKFECDFFIYLQEDFFIYKEIDIKKIEEYHKFLMSNSEYSFIRLLKSGALGEKKITNTLYEIESTNQDIFSMQATIWKTSDYIKLLEEVKDNKWLENEKYREAAIKLDIKGLYHYDGEPKRGEAHYDSNVFPYIATALVRGKWNLSEYPNELGKIGKEYNIDFIKRGIY
jgi:hypothetical protein